MPKILRTTNNKMLRLGNSILRVDVPWTPAQLSTIAWYDASDLSTISQVGGYVSQWNDKSGNLRHLVQASASNQPITNSRKMNGYLNVLDFDGGDYMQRTGFPVSNASMSVIMVAQIDSIDNISDAIFSTSASKDFSLEAYNATQFNGRVFCVGASNPSPALTGGPFQGPSIYNAHVNTNGFNIQAYVDGTLRASAAYIGAISSTVTFRIFACRNATCFPNGAVAEVIVRSRNTTTERQQIEGYLAWKWGTVSSLPLTHPYKIFPPQT